MNNPLREMAFATQAVHAGEHAPSPDFHPVVTPIYPSIAYSYDDTNDLDAIFDGTREGYIYQRYGNPTTHALEQAVAT